jgi:hypothetical protein
MTLTDEARQFWSAAYFLRQATNRDRSQAVKVLRHLSRTAQGTIAAKAVAVLAEWDNVA